MRPVFLPLPPAPLATTVGCAAGFSTIIGRASTPGALGLMDRGVQEQTGLRCGEANLNQKLGGTSDQRPNAECECQRQPDKEPTTPRGAEREERPRRQRRRGRGLRCGEAQRPGRNLLTDGGRQSRDTPREKGGFFY